MDGALDWMADLSWFGNDAGYLVVVVGTDDASPAVVRDLTGNLPGTTDRMRTGGTGYIVVIETTTHRELVLRTLADENGRLERDSRIPWANDVRPVEVVDHEAS